MIVARQNDVRCWYLVDLITACVVAVIKGNWKCQKHRASESWDSNRASLRGHGKSGDFLAWFVYYQDSSLLNNVTSELCFFFSLGFSGF